MTTGYMNVTKIVLGVGHEYPFNITPLGLMESVLSAATIGLTLIPAWISNFTHYDAWDEITYPFLNFNGATVEV